MGQKNHICHGSKILPRLTDLALDDFRVSLGSDVTVSNLHVTPLYLKGVSSAIVPRDGMRKYAASLVVRRLKLPLSHSVTPKEVAGPRIHKLGLLVSRSNASPQLQATR